MFRDGVFVPPTCPTSPRGHLPDLRKVPFSLDIGERTADGHGGPCRDLEIFVVFGEAGEYGEFPNSVTSSSLIVPIDSALAIKARRIVGSNNKNASAEASKNRLVAKVRDILCARVANCRGITKGECWALGTDAVKEAIEKA